MKELIKESLDNELIRSTTIYAFITSVIIITCAMIINIFNGIYYVIIIGSIMDAIIIYSIIKLIKYDKK